MKKLEEFDEYFSATPLPVLTGQVKKRQITKDQLVSEDFFSSSGTVKKHRFFFTFGPLKVVESKKNKSKLLC